MINYYTTDDVKGFLGLNRTMQAHYRKIAEMDDLATVFIEKENRKRRVYTWDQVCKLMQVSPKLLVRDNGEIWLCNKKKLVNSPLAERFLHDG